MMAAKGNSSGALVIEAKKICKSFADRPIVRDFSIRIKRGDRVGVVGPNGAGKTTLVTLLTGELGPDSGTLRLGTNLEIVWLDQRRAGLDPQISVQELLGGGSDQIIIDGRPKHVIGYMRDFLFNPEQARTPLGKLSGGERGRLALAQALARASNLMVLDEPTNDLDLETLDLLQDMLGDYQGTVIVVSHDRDFLDRVSTSVIVAEADGYWQEYAGGYSDMVAQRGFGVAAAGAPIAPNRRENSSERSVGRPKIPPNTKRRLSFKDKHALETLPARIEALRAQMTALQQKLADPRLYERDAAAFDETSRAFVSAEQALAEAEDQWLELEIRREEMEP
jgi:ATP-binding cassette subfamily F protein uup